MEIPGSHILIFREYQDVFFDDLENHRKLYLIFLRHLFLCSKYMKRVPSLFDTLFCQLKLPSDTTTGRIYFR
jgi:hypothetical protein